MPAYKPGDVVVVPFPFTERLASKRRPALVCSSDSYNGATRHLVLAMITTSAHAKWPGDVAIRDLGATGLPAPSTVRWKLFTLDASLVLRRAGVLSVHDREACAAQHPIAL
ncbi:MAG: type II toxin-antitoxin system PemK/MazF family toxin [Gemmatimonadaceae bacterium]|nr:type II toxin-antitoxin system PemK/MazF family toxin [Gemmatimonadaceae bacterium]MCW5826015.1 type II toxin-antitoxin system PemK/MazF family toxin [Gemmatimonadaceae bacterium]